MKQQQKRATFEDVCKAQDSLINIIDKCIEENRCLTKAERDRFRNIYRLGTLGLGSEFDFVIKGEKKSYKLGHVGHAANWIAYRDNNIISIGEDNIEIKFFWLKLRDMLFTIFDYSIETAIKISKEQTHLGISEPAEV